MTPTDTDPLIGQRLNEYQVLEAVASGGMGVVYRGLHPVIQKRAAIKVLKLGNEKAGDYELLVREAQAANAISHRNIVDVFGIGRLPDGRAYIIMEYLEGQALDAYLAGHKLPLLEVVHLLFDCCAPLSAAHKAGVIHRDLKPSNVFLCNQPDGGYFLKLLDFGLAKRSMSLDGVTEQTAKATVAGTPDYMAPEQAQGKAVSPRTDLYALGCIGYEMLTGRAPYSAATPFDVMVAHVRAPVPRASALAPTVPRELDELLLKMMAKKPEDRPQSADEVRDALLPLLESLGAASASAKTGPRPSLSGEFIVRAARASGQRAAEKAQSAETDDALPIAAAAAQAESPTDDALPKARSRWPLFAGGAVVLVAAALGVMVITQSSTPTPSLPAGERVGERGDPPPKAQASKPEPTAKTDTDAAKTDAAKTDAAKADAAKTDAAKTIPDDEAELDELIPLPSGLTPKKDARPAPTEQELRKRLAALEARLRKSAPPGEPPDPAALQYLAKYRVQATMADTPAQRTKLARQLDHWERLFLSR